MNQILKWQDLFFFYFGGEWITSRSNKRKNREVWGSVSKTCQRIRACLPRPLPLCPTPPHPPRAHTHTNFMVSSLLDKKFKSPRRTLWLPVVDLWQTYLEHHLGYISLIASGFLCPVCSVVASHSCFFVCFCFLTAARPSVSGEFSAPEVPGREDPTVTTLSSAPGSTSQLLHRWLPFDFALAPLRGLDVQTSPERAEREGPTRGRRREAPPLKGAGWVLLLLGRTRRRKEGAGRGAELGMPAASGWAAEGWGCVSGLPTKGSGGRARGRCWYRRRPPCGSPSRGRRSLVPSPEGPWESKAKASRADFESWAAGVALEEAGWVAGGRCQRTPPGPRGAHAAGTPGASLKAAPSATLFPLFCYIVGAERMSERAVDDVRGEPRRVAAAAGGAAAARLQQQHQPLQPQPPQRQQPTPRRPRPEDSGPSAASSSATAVMATVGDRRPLPSPETMLGQSWNLWVDASKLPGKDGECPRPPFPHALLSPVLWPISTHPPSYDQPPRGSEILSLSWVRQRCPHLLHACVSLRHAPSHWPASPLFLYVCIS